MADKLLPCPFCGGEAQPWRGGFNGPIYAVTCLVCDAWSGDAESEPAAIAAWNRRPTPPTNDGDAPC